MLLVDDDEAKVLHRGEDTRARGDDDHRVSSADAAPLVGAFGVTEGAVENGDAIAEAREELPGDGGGQGDLRDEKEGAASAGERGVDAVEVDLGLAGAGDTVEEKGFEAPRGDGVLNCVESGLLRRVELVRRADRRTGDREGFANGFDKSFAGKLAGSGSAVPDLRFDVLEVVGTGMEFEESDEFSLGFIELRAGGRRRGKRDTQMVRRRAKRVAILHSLLTDDQALFLEGADDFVGERKFAFDIAGGEGSAFEGLENLTGGILRSGIERELARGVASGIGEGIGLSAANIGSERQHGAEDFAQGRAVVVGDPAAEAQELVIDDRFRIDEAQDLAGVGLRTPVMAFEDDSRQLASAEGDEDAASGVDAMLERERQDVGKRPIDGNWEADVAIDVVFSHRFFSSHVLCLECHPGQTTFSPFFRGTATPRL